MDTQHLPPSSEPLDASRAGVPAEFVFLIVILCLTMVLGLAGVPGRPEPEAGNGSDALRRGWAESRLADAEGASGVTDGDGAAAESRAPSGR